MRLIGRQSTRTRRDRRRPGSAALALLGLAAAMLPPVLTATQEPASAAVLPEGFVEEVVLSGLSAPTTVQFAPDGRVFVAEQAGLVKSFPGLNSTTPTVVADLRPQVHRFWDRGMLGMALDPAFPTKPHVYVLYTYDDDPNTAATFPAWGDTCPNPPGATADGCVVMGRLSRLDVSKSPALETVLIQDWCQQYPSHSIGQLVFGTDGALYASAGDGASFNFADYGQDGSPVNPCGDPPGGVGGAMTPPTAEGGALRSQDLRTSGDPVGLDGTVIRIDPATGRGMPDNPLAASSDLNAQRIVAYGLRNPFRFDQRPGTPEMWLGDVGWSTFEEINRITDPAGAAAPVNFGWPCYEGPSRQGSYDGLNLDICERLYASPGAHTAPHFAYRHGQQVAGESCTTGSSSTSGIAFQFYEGSSYPSRYRGALFFADYARKCIWVMEKGADGVPAPGLVRPFVQGAAGPVDLKIGPGGDLYYADLSGGTIRRIRYTGTTTPPPPVDCDSTTAGLVGLDIGSPGVAGSTSSTDGRWTVTGGGADIWSTSDQFHYACQPLTGDGTITARVVSQTNTDPWAKAGVMMRASTAAGAAHAMVVVTPSNGVAFQYRSSTGATSSHVAGPTGTVPRWVRLSRSGSTLTGSTSTDGTTWTTIGSTSSVALGTSPRAGLAVTSHNNTTASTAVFEQLRLPGTTSAPSNSAPVPSISTPSSSRTWAVGESVDFAGTATDAEDGSLPAASLTWDVVLHHCGRTSTTDCHEHNVQSFAGTSSGTFTTPDHDWPSHVELRLTAKDSNGATGTTEVELQPKTVDLTFATSPSGLSLVVGGDTPTTPHVRTFIVGAGTAIGATSPQTLNGTTYQFQSWSHGGAANQTLTVPATATTYTATYAASAPAGISLTASGYKVKGVQHAKLGWQGATSTLVDVYRNGAVVARGTANDGSHVDRIGKKGGGSYVYKVCESAGGPCSNDARVTF